MVKDPPLPFEVGQLVETKSFIPGYRGAWFCCKITKISWRKDRIGHILHYIDFPDEKEKWTESYQVPPTRSTRKRKDHLIDPKKGNERKRQLMMRPSYPPIYHGDQLPWAREISEVIVITSSSWHVGDLVDWLKDGCYWSGKVTQILGNEEAMVDLMPPPKGEGGSYKASFCDLRPALDWSLEDGWTVPTSKDVGNFHQCARIMYPMMQSDGSQLALEVPAQIEGMIDPQVAIGLPSALSLSSYEAVGSPGEKEILQVQSPKEEISARGTSMKLIPGDRSDSPKKFKACTEIPLNSTNVDTLEAAIIDLEELANKLTWLKEILKCGMPLSNAAVPSWEFIEHRGSSVPK